MQPPKNNNPSSQDVLLSSSSLHLVGEGFNLESAATCLYGRSNEINQLAEIYRRCKKQQQQPPPPESAVAASAASVEDNRASGKQELVLISGRSGTGKTTLANTLLPLVGKDSGFFLSGKFELSGSQEPYAAFVSAFAKFVLGLVEENSNNNSNNNNNTSTLPSNNNNNNISDDDDKSRMTLKICKAVQEAVGSEGKVLTDLIPSLERLIGPQVETCQISGTEGLHRLQRVFSRCCRAMASVAPLVLFLDDLQWANQGSLALLESLLHPLPGQESTSLLVIGSYRSDEVDDDIFNNNNNNEDGDDEDDKEQPTRPFQNTPFSIHLRNNWVQQKPPWLNITTIEISDLDEMSVNELTAAKLKLSCSSSRPLAALVYRQSKGNVFHALQYLRMLADHGFVYRDHDTQEIKWGNLETSVLPCIQSLQSADAVVCEKLHGLPEFHLKTLQVAACLGDEFEASKLGLLMEDQNLEVVSALEMAVSEGLLDHDLHQGLYRFRHDRIRQATLSTIVNKDELAFQIGTKLRKRLSPISLSASIHVVANLLNKGIDRIHDQPTRYQIAALNLEAGLDAAAQAAFMDAAEYLKKGINLLKTGDYWNERYELTLALFNALADVEVCNQNFMKVSFLAAEVFVHAKSHKDKMNCYVAKINAIGQNGSVLEALNFGLEVLQLIGEPLPPVPSNSVILAEKFKTMLALRGRSNESLLSLPPMVDEDKMAVVHILDILIPYSFQSSPPYAILIGMKIVRLCLKYGLTKRGAVGFVTFAWFLCKVDRKDGYRIGQLALSLVANTRAREMIPRVHLSFYFLTHHWTRPIKDSLEPLQETARIGMEIGDIEYAMYSSYFHCTHALYAGVNLLQVETFTLETTTAMKRYKQENALQMVNPTLYYVLHMIGRTEEESNFWDNIRDTDNKAGLLNQFSFGAEVAYMFGDYAKAQNLVTQRLGLSFVHFAMYGHSMNAFYDGLIAVALARQGDHVKRHLKYARKMLKRLEIWAKDCPVNFICKQKLLSAEIHSVTSRGIVNNIHKLYGEAFELASKYGFTQEAALACERAGDYMHKCREDGLAATYWAKAHSLYTEWGGIRKADHLRSEIESRLRQPPSSK